MGFHESWRHDNSNQYNTLDEDVFWYVEPGANLEINISKALRLNLGASKRFVNNLSLQDVGSNDFNGWSYNFSIKIGRF
jgi:hypothetical protein